MSSYGMWLSAAGMQVNEHRQNVLANNLANAQTAGFKHDLAIVAQRRIASRAAAQNLPYVHPVFDGMGGGLSVKQSSYAQDQGFIEFTGRPLDVAIEGDGFFPVSDGDAVRYTRDGAWTTNASGELVLSAGGGRWRVLSESGDPIAINPLGSAPEIMSDGRVRQDGLLLGRIELRAPADPRDLRKVGENLFAPWNETQDTMTAADGQLHGRSIEHSTFDMMQGLASMIEATRAYQMNATMLQLQDQATGQAVSRVGAVA